MECLPQEVTDLFCKHLNQSELYIASTVCHSWYPIFTRSLYSHVTLHHEKTVAMFLNTFTDHIRCAQAWKYIKCLNMQGMTQANIGGAWDSIDFKHVFAHCPNLTELKVLADSDIFSALMDCSLTRSVQLRTLFFYNVKERHFQ